MQVKTTTPDRRGAGATEGRGGCITQHNIPGTTQHKQIILTLTGYMFKKEVDVLIIRDYYTIV